MGLPRFDQPALRTGRLKPPAAPRNRRAFGAFVTATLLALCSVVHGGGVDSGRTEQLGEGATVSAPETSNRTPSATGDGRIKGPRLAPTVSIRDNISVRGQNAVVPVSYRSQGAAVSALQVDLEHDHGALTITAMPGRASVDAGKTLSTYALADGKTRLVIAGINGNAIPDGSLVELSIRIRPAARTTRYRLDLHNVVAADPAAMGVAISAQSGSIVNRRKGNGGGGGPKGRAPHR